MSQWRSLLIALVLLISGCLGATPPPNDDKPVDRGEAIIDPTYDAVRLNIQTGESSQSDRADVDIQLVEVVPGGSPLVRMTMRGAASDRVEYRCQLTDADDPGFPVILREYRTTSDATKVVDFVVTDEDVAGVAGSLQVRFDCYALYRPDGPNPEFSVKDVVEPFVVSWSAGEAGWVGPWNAREVLANDDSGDVQPLPPPEGPSGTKPEGIDADRVDIWQDAGSLHIVVVVDHEPPDDAYFTFTFQVEPSSQGGFTAHTATYRWNAGASEATSSGRPDAEAEAKGVEVFVSLPWEGLVDRRPNGAFHASVSTFAPADNGVLWTDMVELPIYRTT